MESRKSVNVCIPYSPANEKRKLTKCRWSSLPLLLLSSEHVWLNLGLNRSLRVNALWDVAKETGPGAGTGRSANPDGVSMSSRQRQP